VFVSALSLTADLDGVDLDCSGAGTTLILRDFKPSGKPGIMLKLLAMAGPR
jgi:hypothetical protein